MQLKGSGSGSGLGGIGSKGGESKAGQGEGAGAAGGADGADGSNGSNETKEGHFAFTSSLVGRREKPEKLKKVKSFYEESRVGRKGSIMMKDAKGKDHLSDEAKKYVCEEVKK